MASLPNRNPWVANNGPVTRFWRPANRAAQSLAPATATTPINAVRVPNPFVGPLPLRRLAAARPTTSSSSVVRTDLGDVRFWFTGASSDGAAQASQAASLGGYRSSTEATRVGLLFHSGIAGLVVELASRDCIDGRATGTLKADPAGVVRFTASDTSDSQWIALNNGDSAIVRDGDNQAKWLRVRRSSASAPSGTSIIRFHDQFSNVFAMSDAAEAESAAGGSRYRGIAVTSHTSATNLRFWLASLATQATSTASQLAGAGAGTISGATDCFIDWDQQGWALVRDQAGTIKEAVYYSSRTDSTLTVPALGRARLSTSATAGAATDTIDAIGPYRIAWEPAYAGAVQVIGSQSTAPTGVTWSIAATEATGIGAASFPNGDMGALWLHRELPAGVTGFSRHQCRIAYSFTTAGVTYYGTLAGLFRIADDDLERYELHVGVGDQPDLSAAPDETFTTLPHTTTLTLGTSTTNYLVTNRRNKYNLVTQSLSTTIINVDASGLEQEPPPTKPNGIAWRAASDGSFTLDAIYTAILDGEFPADKWAIYLKTDGTDPDPGVDTPTLVTIAASPTGIAFLSGYATASFPDGTVGKVLLRTKRTSDSAYSQNTDIYSATAATQPALTTPAGRPFMEGVAEAGQ